METSVTERGTQKLPKKSKHTDMTIHWKARDEHFLILPLIPGKKSILTIICKILITVIRTEPKWHG
jgi:hypothetical protein